MQNKVFHGESGRCFIYNIFLLSDGGPIAPLVSYTLSNQKQMSGWPLVREKSGKFDFSSRSGKSQGILQIGHRNFKYQESQGIS